MSKTTHQTEASTKPSNGLVVRPKRRKEPDLDKLVSALLTEILGSADPTLEPRKDNDD